jgi:hypothetical protein
VIDDLAGCNLLKASRPLEEILQFEQGQPRVRSCFLQDCPFHRTSPIEDNRAKNKI